MRFPKHYLAAFILALAVLITADTAMARQAKYVFFFLGDGMANAQIQATEAYLTTLNGGSAELAEDLLNPENRLNMTQMPIQGMQTTFDMFSLMTDSASAATAFACGAKTVSGTIGMDDTRTIRYKSIAQLAHEQGRKVGIISSVSLDHATPAAYYASIESRSYMNNICSQLPESGFEFFGGGGLKSPTSAAKEGDTNIDAWQALETAGYTVLENRDAILALKENPLDKVVCINPWLQDAAAMPYAIDRPDTNLSLAQITEVAIASLYTEADGRRNKSKKRETGQEGFFIMVEGGKIDWACHANDAMATLSDMLAFDEAIGVALKFLAQHPFETLIVVTGDHETGGMTIGHATTAYTANYDQLVGQTCSFQYFQDNIWPAHKAAFSTNYTATVPNNLENSAEIKALMATHFGLNWDELNDYQKEKLEDAYDQSMSGTNDNSKAENSFLYGHYEPIIVTLTHIVNERASIGWTSYSHTGVPVPVYAKGRGAALFAGFYDNTDIAKRLARVMAIREQLPVEKE